MPDLSPETVSATEAIATRPNLSTWLSFAAERMSPRTWVRTGFLGFFLFACWQLWRYYQWALGAGPYVPRPDATAGFVPLGGLMSISAWAKGGAFDPVMPAATIILLAAVTVSVLLKRGFCGWVCPVGTTASVFGWLGRTRTGGRPRRMSRWLDIALRVPKYVVGANLLVWVFSLPAQIGIDFQQMPYYATSDLKILYGLVNPAWGYWALAAFVGLTAVATGTNTWCRYLCPLGAIYGGLSALSLGTVKRDTAACVNCKRCDAACAARIEVSSSTRAVRSPECDGCQDCVRACPVPHALTSRLGGLSIPWQYWAALLVATWLLIWAIAVSTGHWDHGLPDSVIAAYMRTMKLTHDF